MTPLETLDISQTDASEPKLLKRAYHAALLKVHPDTAREASPERHGRTVDSIRAAYLQLSAALLEDNQSQKAAKETFGYTEVDLDDFESHAARDADTKAYTLECRCGSNFRITEDDLERGHDLVACAGCSLLVRVLYEEVDVEEAGLS